MGIEPTTEHQTSTEVGSVTAGNTVVLPYLSTFVSKDLIYGNDSYCCQSALIIVVTSILDCLAPNGDDPIIEDDATGQADQAISPT